MLLFLRDFLASETAIQPMTSATNAMQARTIQSMAESDRPSPVTDTVSSVILLVKEGRLCRDRGLASKIIVAVA